MGRISRGWALAKQSLRGLLRAAFDTRTGR